MLLETAARPTITTPLLMQDSVHAVLDDEPFLPLWSAADNQRTAIG